MTSLLLLMSGMVLCKACFSRCSPSYRRNSPCTAYFMPDITILPITSDGVLIHVGVIDHTDLCAEESRKQTRRTQLLGSSVPRD